MQASIHGCRVCEYVNALKQVHDRYTIKGTHPDVSEDVISLGDEYHARCMYYKVKVCVHDTG